MHQFAIWMITGSVAFVAMQSTRHRSIIFSFPALTMWTITKRLRLPQCISLRAEAREAKPRAIAANIPARIDDGWLNHGYCC